MACEFAPKLFHKKTACNLYDSSSDVCTKSGPVSPFTGSIYCGKARTLIAKLGKAEASA